MSRAERGFEYESVLVAYEDGHFAPEVISTAVKLAARRRRGIHVLVTITVPRSARLDRPMPEEELAAQAIIERARLLGGRRVTGRSEKVRPGEAGRVIVNAARRMAAEAIVMPLPPRRRHRLFGRTIATVLAERPCRVIIEAGPADGAESASLRADVLPQLSR
ncbi:MAG TPA: universal stress protein [Solirubrobacteraceae bacterium]|nr:universal stress protein [Solirubrobacteraceae bacterium]